MASLTVDYQVSVSARVDTDHGTVEYVVVGLSDFNCNEPEAVFNAYDTTLPEYLSLDHPEAVRAIEIANRIEVFGAHAYSGGEIMLRVILRPRATDGA